jgi:hypothetical protein
MRRWLAIFIGLVFVAAAAVAIWIAKDSRKTADNKSSASTISSQDKSKAVSVKTACKIFTLSDAKKLLGDTAKGGQNSVTTSSKDVDVSTCTYTEDSGSNAPVATHQSATLLARISRTPKGVVSNQSQFGPLKPAGVQDVSGYGDMAFWDAQHGQLNILKNNNWFILSNGPITPADRTLDEAKQLADILINKV